MKGKRPSQDPLLVLPRAEKNRKKEGRERERERERLWFLHFLVCRLFASRILVCRERSFLLLSLSPSFVKSPLSNPLLCQADEQFSSPYLWTVTLRFATQTQNATLKTSFTHRNPIEFSDGHLNHLTKYFCSIIFWFWKVEWIFGTDCLSNEKAKAIADSHVGTFIVYSLILWIIKKEYLITLKLIITFVFYAF